MTNQQSIIRDCLIELAQKVLGDNFPQCNGKFYDYNLLRVTLDIRHLKSGAHFERGDLTIGYKRFNLAGNVEYVAIYFGKSPNSDELTCHHVVLFFGVEEVK